MIIGKVWDGEAALAASADMDDRAFNCMHNASAVSRCSVHFFQELDVCDPSSLKVNPALDDLVHTDLNTLHQCNQWNEPAYHLIFHQHIGTMSRAHWKAEKILKTIGSQCSS